MFATHFLILGTSICSQTMSFRWKYDVAFHLLSLWKNWLNGCWGCWGNSFRQLPLWYHRSSTSLFAGHTLCRGLSGKLSMVYCWHPCSAFDVAFASASISTNSRRGAVLTVWDVVTCYETLLFPSCSCIAGVRNESAYIRIHDRWLHWVSTHSQSSQTVHRGKHS